MTPYLEAAEKDPALRGKLAATLIQMSMSPAAQWKGRSEWEKPLDLRPQGVEFLLNVHPASPKGPDIVAIRCIEFLAEKDGAEQEFFWFVCRYYGLEQGWVFELRQSGNQENIVLDDFEDGEDGGEESGTPA